MAVLQRADVALHYEEPGSGRVIVGVHGSPSSSVFWEDAAPALATLGRCLLYDRRGYGRSVLTERVDRIDLADQVADLVALLEDRQSGPAVVIGRSTGGLIALVLAIRRADLVRALVLLEPALFTLDPAAQAWADELREAVLEVADQGPEVAVRVLMDRALGPGTWSGWPAEVRSLFIAGGDAMVAEMRGDGLDLSAEPFAPTAKELASVTCPTLILSGDASYPAARAVDDKLVTALADARHHIVAGGHVIDPAHPAVLAFVAEVLGQASAGAAG